jgi:hypothetical protein
MYQKHVPENFNNVGRFWGCAKKVKPEPIAAKTIEDRDELRYWLNEWEYLEKLSHSDLSVLFNASPEVIQRAVDGSSNKPWRKWEK